MELICDPATQDHHMHTDTFSDGTATLEELVRYADIIGLEEIAITDHSDAALKLFGPKIKFLWWNFQLPYKPTASRGVLDMWENVHNDTRVLFGVEGDILNERGDISDTVRKKKGAYLVLSLHPNVYASNHGDPNKATQAYINAIERHHETIKVIGHPTANIAYGARALINHVDMPAVAEIANKYDIAFEINGSYVKKQLMNEGKTRELLENANFIQINSDAHLLNGLRDFRKLGLEYIQSLGYLTGVTSIGR